MKNIRKFETTAEMESAVLTEPYVLYNEETGLVKTNPNSGSSDNEVDYSTEYLTLEALEDGTFSFTKNGTGDDIQYSKDNGATWTSLASGENVSVVTGDKVMWKSNIAPEYYNGIGRFSSSNKFKVSGNIMSLLYGDEFNGQTSLESKDYVFCRLFENCSFLIDASNLILPAKTLASACYCCMFQNCPSLTTAPELPATTLADYCYQNMFTKCRSLTTAPELPATTLNLYCYQYMFSGCTSLTTAPELPATTLTAYCYNKMFSECTSLTTAPELPATTLADWCYQYMFSSCTSLTTAPELPATTLTHSCYENMFNGCTSLTTAPELPATTLYNCCYENMFNGCTNLSKITMLATDISASYCLNYWVYNVSSTGTFVKHPDMTTLRSGTSGIPNGWVVKDAVL